MANYFGSGAAKLIELPIYQTENEARRVCPLGWTITRVEDAFEKLETGRIWERKELASTGLIPVLDQSLDGIHGFHSGTAGVQASVDMPVVTFANHTCVMRFVSRPFSVIQNVFPLIGRAGICETQFLFYWLNGRVHIEEYKGHFPDLRRLWLPLPTLMEQRAIASLLGALDDKIESNRRLAVTIDGLLRAELENAIRNDDNPREVRFGEVALRVGEASDPRNLPKHVPYIGLEHMPRGNMFLDEWGTSEGLGSGKSVFKEGNVLFGRLRPYFKKVGVAPIDGICSTDVLVLRPAFNESAAMLLALAASEGFIGYASAAATGTKMPRVSWDYLSDWMTVLPSEAATNRFEIDMSPLVAKAIDSIHERIAIAQLRDALLPELLSGRLRVNDAESMMENV